MAGKRKKQVKAEPQEGQEEPQPTELEDAPEHDAPGLTDFELQRMQLIARNRARMQALGIPMASAELSKLVKVDSAPKPQKSRKAKLEQPTQPTRKSARLMPQDPDEEGIKVEVDEDISEEAKELTAFIIDGECPKCGRIVTRGHKAHLERCQGRPVVQPVILTEEELLAQAELLKAAENAKLAALELEGLIDVTPEHAIFMVIGSKGDPYQVTISDKARKCQCIDHKCRKRDCKHIRLTLMNLGCQDEPWMWRQAVDKHFQDAIGLVANAQVKDEEGAVQGGEGVQGDGHHDGEATLGVQQPKTASKGGKKGKAGSKGKGKRGKSKAG